MSYVDREDWPFPLCGICYEEAIIISPDLAGKVARGEVTNRREGPYEIDGYLYWLEASGKKHLFETPDKEMVQDYYFVPNVEDREKDIWNKALYFLYVSSKRFTRSEMFFSEKEDMAQGNKDERVAIKSFLEKYMYDVCKAPKVNDSNYQPNQKKKNLYKLLKNVSKQVYSGINGQIEKLVLPEKPEDLFEEEIGKLTEQLKNDELSRQEKSQIAFQRLNLLTAKLTMLSAAKLAYSKAIFSEGLVLNQEEIRFYVEEINNLDKSLSQSVFMRLFSHQEEAFLMIREKDKYLSKKDVDAVLWEVITEIIKSSIFDAVIFDRKENRLKVNDNDAEVAYHRLVAGNRRGKIGQAEGYVSAMEKVFSRCIQEMEKDYAKETKLSGALQRMNISAKRVIGFSKRAPDNYESSMADYYKFRQQFQQLIKDNHYISSAYTEILEAGLVHIHYSVKSKRPLSESLKNMTNELDLRQKLGLSFAHTGAVSR